MSKQKPTVLVVEDEPLLLEAIQKKLTLNDLPPIGCSSGEEALRTLQTLPEIPDIIWLDYHLKDMNGFTFMSKLKEKKEWENIPIIVVSNSASDENVHSMLALGAKGYLLKAEHRLEDIIETVKALIQETKVT